MHRLLFLASLAVASAEVFHPGACPLVHHQDNFDFSRFQGIWYEIKRYPNAGEEGANGKCTTAEYTVYGNVGTAKNTHVVNGVKSYINGALNLVGPATVRLTYTFGDRSKDSFLTILKTDYSNYFVGYSCRFFPERNTHQLFSWVMSRSPVMTSSSLEMVNHYIQVSPVLEADKYVLNDHSSTTCSSAYNYEITDFLD